MKLLEEKKKNIISVAQKRFAHYGVPKTTMDEIAAESGMGKASLYYYFPSKDELYRAVVAREQEEFLEHLEQVVSSDIEPDEKLRTDVQHRLRYFQRLVNLNALNLQSMFAMKPLFRELFDCFGNAERSLMTRIFREGKAKKRFHFKDPEEMAALVLHSLHGLRLRALKVAHQEQTHSLNTKELEQEMTLLINLILKGITA